MPRPQAMEQRVSVPYGGNCSIRQPSSPGYSPGNRAAPQVQNLDNYLFTLKTGTSPALASHTATLMATHTATLMATLMATPPTKAHTDVSTPPRTARCYKRTTTTTRSKA